MTDAPRIPLNDLARGTILLRSDLDAAIARVLDRGYYVLGPENTQLEAELSAYLGAADIILVGNGTDALQLALSAVGVARNDVVMTVANAGGYTSTAVRALGAEPLYSDIEPETQLMSLRTVEEALARATTMPKAIVVTHLFGSAVDIAPIVALAESNGIAVVEDCAQALGAERDGKKVGTFGDIATTSFYPTKNLGALGDAGAVFTSTPELAARVRQLRQYGWASKYRTTVAGGMNSRLDEMQAAILRVKLPYLDGWNTRRREVHAEYESAVGAGARFVTKAVDGFIGHLAVIEVADRARARELLHAAGVGTDVHYPVPDHLQELIEPGSTPRLEVTERAAESILSVPLFPELLPDEVALVCHALSQL